MEVLHLNQESFEKLTNQKEKSVLIDFGATWCGPCQMLGPELEKFAAAHSDIIVGKIDVDECRDLAITLGIVSVPTLFFYSNGEMAKKLVGYMSADDLAKKLGL